MKKNVWKVCTQRIDKSTGIPIRRVWYQSFDRNNSFEFMQGMIEKNPEYEDKVYMIFGKRNKLINCW
jgi:hypothetical protein